VRQQLLDVGLILQENARLPLNAVTLEHTVTSPFLIPSAASLHLFPVFVLIQATFELNGTSIFNLFLTFF